MFALSAFSMSLAPLPPAPMPPMLRRLLAPRTVRRATKGKARTAPATAVCWMNWRRVMVQDFIIGVGDLVRPIIDETTPRSRLPIGSDASGIFDELSENAGLASHCS